MGFILDTINQLFATRTFELSEEQLKQMEALNDYIATLPVKFVTSKEKAAAKERWNALFRSTTNVRLSTDNQHPAIVSSFGTKRIGVQSCFPV